MREHYTIGQLAMEAGVPTSTLRYYERRGLLRPSGRTTGNYRSYTSASLLRLRFIREAQASGLSLRDIASLMELIHDTEAPCPAIQSILQVRLQQVDERIEGLRRAREGLQCLLASCQEASDADLCRTVDELRR